MTTHGQANFKNFQVGQEFSPEWQYQFSMYPSSEEIKNNKKKRKERKEDAIFKFSEDTRPSKSLNRMEIRALPSYAKHVPIQHLLIGMCKRWIRRVS